MIRSSTDNVYTDHRWWPMAAQGLLGTQCRDNQELVPHTLHLGNARPKAQRPKCHYTGLPDFVSPYREQRMQRIKNCSRDTLQPVRIPSYALWINEHGSHILGSHRELPTVIHSRICDMPPRPHTDLFNQREGAWQSGTKSAKSTPPIQPLLHS